MKRGCQKRLNAKFQLNAITSYFVLFSIQEEISINVTGRKFSNLGIKEVCQKKAKCEISAESDNFIFRPISYSRGNRCICHRKKIFKFMNEKGMPNKAKCEIYAESDNFLFRPIFHSRGNRYVCHRKKIFKFSN